MNDTATKERSKLDDFAAEAPPARGELAPTQSYLPPAERHGALAVEVRRDEARIRQKIRELAAMAGEEWYYRWPVKNKRERSTKWVEGLSIKGADALVGLYWNCKVDCRAQDLGTHWVFYAQFVDYETGSEWVRPFQQRKSAGRMGDDAERNLDIAHAIGVSKAERNVIIHALQTYADFALTEAKQALVDKIGGELERYRRVTVERVQTHVDLARVEAIIGRAAKEWLAPDIARIIAMGKAIDDGMASWNESFPPLKSEKPEATALDAFAKNSAPAKHAPPATVGAEPAGVSSTTPTPAVREAARKEAIDKMLALATDPLVDLEDRLANLDALMPVWEDKLGSAGFVKTLFDTAAKVAKQQLTIDAARNYLERLS